MLTVGKINKLLQGGHYETLPENRPAKVLKRGFRAWWSFFAHGLLPTCVVGTKHILARRTLNQHFFSKLSLMIFRAVEKTGGTIVVENSSGLNKLNGRPCVYAANHMSLIETMLLPGIVGAFGTMTVVAKKSLSKYPLFGACLKSAKPILLERKNARQDLHETITQGKERLAEGISIIIFPQGARLLNFNPKKFNSLATKLAREAGVPLVPIACKTDYALPGKLLKDFGPIDPERPIKFSIGPILEPSLSQGEIQEQAITFIQNKLTEWDAINIDPSKSKRK